MHFNPRARVGRDYPQAQYLAAPTDFNPRARVGRDLGTKDDFSKIITFQSTRPRGARRDLLLITDCNRPNFNPRARVGRD